MGLSKITTALIAIATLTIIGCSNDGGGTGLGAKGGKNTGKTGTGQQTPNGAKNPPATGGSTTTVSCHIPTNGLCYETTAPTASAGTYGKYNDACDQTGGKYAQSSCPRAGHIGTCTMMGEEGYAVKMRYYSPNEVNQIAQGCDASNGQFSTEF